MRIFFASIIDASIKLVRSFPHYFKTISTVMFPSRLKSRFPSALVALLWQAAFYFPNRLFHEFLSKNQANHNLPFVKHAKCFARYILQYSAFPWLLIPYIFYACAYFVLRRHWNTFNQLKMNLNHWKITPHELYSNILVYTLLHYCKNKKKKKPSYRLPRWSLPYFVENANETSQQLKDNYLITTWIVNRASRATHANWVSWQMRVS